MNITPEKDGTLEKLPPAASLGNALSACGWPLVGLACAQWLYNTYRANQAGRFEWPVTLEFLNMLVGESSVVILDRLHQYGISTQLLYLNFELWPDKKGIGLRGAVWVPRSQAAMADDILRQHAGQMYCVDSPRIGKGYTYGKPWGVYAKPRSWDEAVSAFIFSLVIGRSSVGVGKTEKPQALPKAEPRRQTPTVKRRKPAKSQSTIKRIARGIWNA